MKKAFTLILGVLAAGTMFTLAQGEDDKKPERRGPGGGGPGAGRRGPSEEFIKKHDKDKDGKLSREEMTAAREAMQKEADTNGDGKVDADERKAALVKRLTPRYDENKDGKLDKAEKAKLDAALARFGNRGPRPGGEGRPGGRRGGEGGGRPGGRPGGRDKDGDGEGKPKPKPADGGDK